MVFEIVSISRWAKLHSFLLGLYIPWVGQIQRKNFFNKYKTKGPTRHTLCWILIICLIYQPGIHGLKLVPYINNVQKSKKISEFNLIITEKIKFRAQKWSFSRKTRQKISKISFEKYFLEIGFGPSNRINDQLIDQTSLYDFKFIVRTSGRALPGINEIG